ncbi:MAG: glycosyltransferase family 4 protein [Anaerolineaceae bacterium]|nr:glycosyltransferase family 4 protein [Anaerolineaceae bacterium]
MNYKIAALTSHPVQYQAPLFQALASRPEINLVVFYRSDSSIRGNIDQGFGIPVRWDRPLLEGYEYQFLRSPLEIISVLARRKFDALLVHSYATPLSLAGYLGSIFFQTPLLLHTESEMLHPRKVLLQRTKSLILKTLFSRTAALLSIGKQNYSFYKSFNIPDARIFHTPYCVDNDYFLEQAGYWKAGKVETLAELSLPAQQPTIIFSGKLISRKRPLDLLNAFQSLTQDGWPANLVFIGEGTLRREIERHIQENQLQNVRLVGFKNQSEISKYYAIGDIFVLPSGFDTWGLVINEGMLFSMPVITTEMVGAGYDLVEEGGTGYTYPAGDVNSLKQHLITLLADTKLRETMGHAARQKVRDYNYTQCVEGILDALRSIIG